MQRNTNQHSNYTTKEIILKNNNKAIYGVAFIPKRIMKAFPTVIFSHAFNDTHESGFRYAKYLAEYGIATYCFDFCGGSTVCKSDGKTIDMSPLTQVNDLNCVVDQMKEMNFVDSNQLFLMGVSQGGFVSAVTASMRNQEIRGLILLSPAFELRQKVLEMFDSPDNSSKSNELMGMPLGTIYLKDLWNYNIYDHISDYTNDVLIFHGDLDEEAPIKYSKKAVEIYNLANIKVFNDEGHHFSSTNKDKIAKEVLEFIQSHIIK